MSDFDDIDEYLAPEEEDTRPRDPKIDEAKPFILEQIFNATPTEVFYGQQIEALCEETYYHWITGRALNELVAERKVQSEIEGLNAGTHIRFYSAKGNRYWTRRRREIKKLVQEYSTPNFTQALGLQGEMMFDAAMPAFGFNVKAKNVRSYNGVTWDQTGHNLDRVLERDGIAYGVEIKNTLPYISHQELRIKAAMAKAFGTTPMFIFRFAPKSYIHEVHQLGGFVLLFKDQMYPFGFADLARRVRTELHLPVACPTAVPDGHMQRFLKWHRAKLNRRS